MKIILFILLSIFPLTAQVAQVENNLSFSRNGSTINLSFGIDSSATENLDPHLGEIELPPFPPSNIFDARFVGTTIGIELGNGTLKDFRFGELPLQKEVDHEVYLQNQNNEVISVEWNFSEGVSASLIDFFNGSIVNLEMQGTGSSTINIGFLTNLKLIAAYSILTKVDKISTNQIYNLKISAYPNPFNGSSNIEIYSERSEMADIKVINSLGQQIIIDRIKLSEGYNNYKINLKHRSSGNYFLSISNSKNFGYCKLILTK
jgi:hypothetical protein